MSFIYLYIDILFIFNIRILAHLKFLIVFFQE